MIGAKTITSLALFVGMTMLVFFEGYLDIAYLVQLDPWVAAFLGLFAMLTGTMVVRIWRLDERSITSFSYSSASRSDESEITLMDHIVGKIKVGENLEEPPWDLPPGLQRLVYIVVFLWVGLFTFNNRTFALLKDLPARLGSDSRQYCEEESKTSVPKGAESQGCELLLRAFRLGFAKDLGPCERKDTDTDDQPCTLRQKDEPYLHYTWRLLQTQIVPLLDLVSLTGFRKFGQEMENKLKHIELLYHAQSRAVLSTQRASHHLFTNLPPPDQHGFRAIGALWEPGYCTGLTSVSQKRLAMTGEKVTLGRVLEQVYNQLFLDPAHKPIVGVCAEHTIHWGVDPDACRQLKHNPRLFLERLGIWDELVRVIGRHERDSALLNRLGFASVEKPGSEATQPIVLKSGVIPSLEKIISFQCFMETDSDRDSWKDYPVRLKDRTFRASEIRFSASRLGRLRFVELARKLAGLYAPGFRYGRFMSRVSITRRDEQMPVDELFSEESYRLSKLEYLRDLDLFLDVKGITARTDLYEVYPYHLHLKNFVEVFRQQYGLHRGRM